MYSTICVCPAENATVSVIFHSSYGKHLLENSSCYIIIVSVLYAGVDNLDQQALFGKVCMIILYDDVQTTTAWRILNQFT